MSSADNLKVSTPTPKPASPETPIKPSSAHGTEAAQASADPDGSDSHPQVEAIQPTGGSVDPLTGTKRSQETWDQHDKEYYEMVELELRKAKATKRQASYIRQKFNGTISQAICMRLHPDSTYLQQYEAEKQALSITRECFFERPQEWYIDLSDEEAPKP
ncbi:hypothetical protein AAVH_29173 [Aphelenchoides avenae]|nr:hypothetical protein AAVH_29173 [Aphelenchus avenae]